jgi:hypothetical protein
MSEKETRDKLIRHAERLGGGAAEDLMNLLYKWDMALALAPESEREEMSKMAILDVQKLLDIRAEDGLTINDEIILNAKK